MENNWTIEQTKELFALQKRHTLKERDLKSLLRKCPKKAASR